MVAAGAEGYVNRYRRGWDSSVAAVKQYIEDARRNKRGTAPPVSQLPAPVPLPKHTWPVTAVRINDPSRSNCHRGVDCFPPHLHPAYIRHTTHFISIPMTADVYPVAPNVTRL